MFDTIQELQAYSENLSNIISRRTWERDSLNKQLTDAEDDLSTNQANLNILFEIRDVLQDTATKSRDFARNILQTTITTALQYIFGADYSCNIHIPDDTLKPEAYIYIIKDCNGTQVQTEPIFGRGGGIVDVVSLALRAAMIQLQNNPPSTGPIILDEPGKMVSAQYGVKLAEFIAFLSKELNRQIILTTHNMDIAVSATKVFAVDMINNSTVVTDTGEASNGKMPEL